MEGEYYSPTRVVKPTFPSLTDTEKRPSMQTPTPVRRLFPADTTSITPPTRPGTPFYSVSPDVFHSSTEGDNSYAELSIEDVTPSPPMPMPIWSEYDKSILGRDMCCLSAAKSPLSLDTCRKKLSM